jgi:large subunit ribosomal protein L4
MKLSVTTLDGKSAGTVDVSDEVFGLEPRIDLIHRMIRWQLAKRQQGTHDVKNRSEINRTKSKMYKQKGTGGARHGSKNAPLFRGGGRAFGPTPRSHAHDLTKKFRGLALRHALSSKVKGNALIVVDDVVAADAKTKALKAKFDNLGFGNVLIIGGAEIDRNFTLASRNLPHVDVLPVQGINVYDILRRDKLVLTKAALEALEARFQ